MRKSSLFTLFILAVLVTSILVPSGSAAADPLVIPVTEPGDLATPGATYVLQADITATGTCFTISADGITLDGNGHTITRNSSGFWEYGVYLQNRSGVTIKNLTVKGFSWGIWLYRCNNSTLTENAVSSSRNYGIYLDDYCDYNTIIGNNVSNNYFLGISLYRSNYNIISTNTFSGNLWFGMMLINSGGNLITGNTVSSSPKGIQLEWGGSNIFTNNTITDSSSYGIYSYWSFNNEIYNNNFINNSTQAYEYSASPGNSFNRLPRVGGNYWSDHDDAAEGCTDSDGDGICDSPYVFLGGNSGNFDSYDYFPWTTINGWSGLENSPPTADANGDQVIDEGSSLILDGTGSYDADGDGLVAEWVLAGDSFPEIHALLTPLSSNALKDDFDGDAILTVTDPFDETDTDSAHITVLNVAPVMQPIVIPVDTVFLGTAVEVSVIFTDPGINDTHTATWDWGDGNTSGGTVDEANGAGSVTGSHIYTSAGVYTVTMTLTDDDGASDTDTATVTVMGPVEAIQDLVSVIQDIDLPHGTENSLISKLENALKSLEKENEGAAINQLEAFINAVEAQRGKKITDDDADALIATAQLIIDLIGGEEPGEPPPPPEPPPNGGGGGF